MASVFSDNINFIGDKPNFDRDKVSAIAQLASEEPAQKCYPYGHIVFCEEDGCHYKFNYNHKNPPAESEKNSLTGWFVPLDKPVDFTNLEESVAQNGERLSQESERALEAENALSEELQNETTRALEAENALSGRISDNVDRIADIESVLSESTDMLDTLENVAAWIEDDSTGSADVIADVQKNSEDIHELKFQTSGLEVEVMGAQYTRVPAVKAGNSVTFILLDTENGPADYAIYVKYGENGTDYHLGGKYISLSNNKVTVTTPVDFDRVMLWWRGTYENEHKFLYIASDDVTLQNKLDVVKQDVAALRKRDINYGMLKYAVPVFSKTKKTLTLPSGTLLMGGNKQLNLSSDLVIDNTSDASYGSHYIAIDLSSAEPAYRLIRPGFNITLNNDNEFIIALLDWASGFVWINSRTYIVDGVTYEKEINPATISKIQSNVADVDATLKKSLLETTGYEVVCLAAYAYFPAISKGDKIEITLLSDVGAANLAIYVSDNQYPASGYAVNIGYLKTGGSVTLDVPDKFNSISYIKLWASGMDGIEKVVRIKSKNRTLATPVVGKFYNVPLNIKKPNLKILDIGNSYTENATYYINSLLRSAGVTEAVQNHSHYIAVRGGASFKSWYDCYNDADKTNRYYITHKSGKPLSTEPSWTEVTEQTGDGCINGEAFRHLLNNTHWDLIIIHQASTYAADYDKWEKQESAGYLRELIRLVKETNPQATIGTYLVHSYNTNNENYSKYGTSLDRWKACSEAVKSLKQNYGIDFVIPYGTAVQNLRSSSLQDNFQFSHDGTHLGRGLGCYVASCCYFQSLFAARYDVNIVGNPYNNISLSDAANGEVPVNTANALVAQKAALLAVCDMFKVQNPDEHSAVSDNGTVSETYNSYGFDAALSDTSANAVQNKVVKATIDSQRTELIKRIQGTSENSNRGDAFRVLGTYNSITDLQAAVSSIDTFAAKGEVSGKWRAYFDSNIFEIDMRLLVWNAVPSAGGWIQTIKSHYKAGDDGNLKLSTRVHELSRMWNFDPYFNTWSSWSSVNKDLDEAKKELEAKIKQSIEDQYFCDEVLWLGTSIPAEGKYPERVAAELGFTLYNKAKSSSGIVKPMNENTSSIRYVLNLSETVDEMLSKLQNDKGNTGLSDAELNWYIGADINTGVKHTRRVYDDNGSLNKKATEANYKVFYGSSYEDTILPYIDGTLANCKMIVWDHGYNDGRYITKQVQAGYDSIDWNSTDRSTYTGAFRYLLNEIYKIDPDIVVVIAGYFSDNHHENSANYNTKDVCTMQQWIAEKYNLPLVPVWDLLHISDDIVLGSEGKSLPGKNGAEVFPDGFSSHRQFCTDTVHPSVGSPGTWNYNERSIELYTQAMLKGLRDLPGYAASAINDDALSDSSTNGVQNKVVAMAYKALQQSVDNITPKEITWNSASNLAMWTFRFAGIYNIKGERTNKSDGFPINNASPGHTINARLIVLDSSLPQASNTPQEDDACITQILMLSNRMGGEGNIYIRSARGHIDRSKWPVDGSNFTPWAKLQTNMEVGVVGYGQAKTLNDFIDNGIYSGVNVISASATETFVMIVINDYAVAGANRSISQFKYALVAGANTVTYQTRVRQVGGNTWTAWKNLNDVDTALSSTSTNAVQNKVVAMAINTEQTRALEAENALSEELQNETTRATAAENSLQSKINNEISRAATAESTLQSNIETEKKRAETKENELQNDIAAVTPKNVTWDSSRNLNESTFRYKGVYKLNGERIYNWDNVPIQNNANGHTIDCRLIVLDSSLPQASDEPQNDDGCITQILMLSNRVGGDGGVYIRTARGLLSDRDINTVDAWKYTSWKRLQENQEVGVIYGSNAFDNYVDNGIVSGVRASDLANGIVETFVMIVINNYPAVQLLNSGYGGSFTKSVSQFKYAVDMSGAVSYKSRALIGDTWTEWSDINGGSGGSSITIDSKLSSTSTNAVQNRVIAQAIEAAVERGRLLALRSLYLTAGAEYNDTDEIIKKTAFWGDEVDHLPHHYYLNGLGDITEEQMALIYKHKDAMTNILLYPAGASRYFQNGGMPRTLFPHSGDPRFIENKSLSGYYTFGNGIEVIKWTTEKSFCHYKMSMLVANSILYNIKTLRVVDKFATPENNTSAAFSQAVNLEVVRIILSGSIVISDSPKIDRNSILYMINNAVKPTKATTYTITLHSDAYDKYSVDEDVLAAIESKNTEFESISSSIKLSKPE